MKTRIVIGCLLVFVFLEISSPLYFWVTRAKNEESQDEPCDVNSSVLLGNFTSYPNGSIVSDSGEEYPEGFHFTTGRETRGCLCALKPCIRKCCARAEDESVSVFGKDPSKCVNTSEEIYFEDLSLRIYSAPNKISNMTLDGFHILHGDFCSDGLFWLQPETYPYDRNYLLTDGRILLYGKDQVEQYFDTSMYCLERINGSAEVVTFICYKNPEDKLTELQFALYPVGLIVSAFFSFLTLVVYALLPELHANLHGQSLMCHMLSFLFSCVSLSIAQLTVVIKIPKLWCVLLGKSVETRNSWRQPEEQHSVYMVSCNSSAIFRK